MAISNIHAYTHLSDFDIEVIGQRLDALRLNVEETRDARDAKYIKNLIKIQRVCEVSGRLLLLRSRRRANWWAGTALLTLSKILENMEIGHNVMHGQWDWMNDLEVHSTRWEWDHSMPASHWKHAHNYRHHVFTNVIGLDPDEGYGLLRVTRDRRWRPYHLGNILYLVPISLLYEFGMCVYHLEIPKVMRGKKDKQEFIQHRDEIFRKAGRQLLKDYVAFPLISFGGWKATVSANLSANLARNIWEQIITFCGHFPDGAEKFTQRDLESETQGEWYLRQFLGSVNFKSGPLLRVLTGSLGYQIEHHLFPDLPSNRLPEISAKVEELAREYRLPYVSRSLPVQYALTLRTILKLSLPDKYLRSTTDDSPETSSEFAEENRRLAPVEPTLGVS